MLIAILIMLILLALGGLITAVACVGIYHKTYGIYQVQREILATHQVPAMRDRRTG